MRLRDLMNLGPKSEEWLPRAGISTVDELQASDPYEVYAKLKATVPGTNINALYALIGAIENRHWIDIKKERRTEIILRLSDMGLMGGKRQ